MTLIQMHSAAVADTDAAAMVDIQLDGKIVGISWALTIVGSSAGCANAELSFGSSRAPTTNDARQVIDVCGYHFQTGTAESFNKFIACDIDVSAGERIYMHVELVTGTPGTTSIRAILHVMDKAGRTTLRRR